MIAVEHGKLILILNSLSSILEFSCQRNSLEQLVIEISLENIPKIYVEENSVLKIEFGSGMVLLDLIK
ncbi:MAG: hypothetical protein K9W44_17585 [Candidatus Lokiarchaeota archaeon]|nr:hypothetical protein [Candidatus Harpocratesius repetitus]